jgi:MFS family permease
MILFFQESLNLNLTSSGILLTLLWTAYAVGHLPGGIWGDQIGEGNTLAISTLISTSMILVVATSVNMWMLFVGTITFGLATALYGPTRLTIFTNVYPNQSGLAIGLSIAMGSLGNAASVPHKAPPANSV